MVGFTCVLKLKVRLFELAILADTQEKLVDEKYKKQACFEIRLRVQESSCPRC